RSPVLSMLPGWRRSCSIAVPARFTAARPKSNATSSPRPCSACNRSRYEVNFDLTEEQQALRESVRRYLDESYPLETRHQLARTGGGLSRDTWHTFAEMGWLMASVPEAYSGLGFTAVETALIAEQMGRGLVLEPYTLCGIFPAAVLLNCAT